MSEMPTPLSSNEINDMVAQRADHLVSTPEQRDAFFKYAEKQLTIDTRGDESRLDIHAPVEAINIDAVNAASIDQETVAEAETVAQIYERELMAMDKLAIVSYAASVSRALVTMRKLQ